MDSCFCLMTLSYTSMDIDIFGPFRLTALKQAFFLFSILFSRLNSTQLKLFLRIVFMHHGDVDCIPMIPMICCRSRVGDCFYLSYPTPIHFQNENMPLHGSRSLGVIATEISNSPWQTRDRPSRCHPKILECSERCPCPVR